MHHDKGHPSAPQAGVQSNAIEKAEKQNVTGKGHSGVLLVSTIAGVLLVVLGVFVGCYWGRLKKFITWTPRRSGYQEISLEGITS